MKKKLPPEVLEQIAADIANGVAHKSDKVIVLTDEEYEGLYRALQWPEDRARLEKSDRELDSVCRMFGIVA
jgi:hypothetical protein